MHNDYACIVFPSFSMPGASRTMSSTCAMHTTIVPFPSSLGTQITRPALRNSSSGSIRVPRKTSCGSASPCGTPSSTSHSSSGTSPQSSTSRALPPTGLVDKRRIRRRGMPAVFFRPSCYCSVSVTIESKSKALWSATMLPFPSMAGLFHLPFLQSASAAFRRIV